MAPPIIDGSAKDLGPWTDQWYYPDEISEGFEAFELSKKVVDETLATAWEYARSVIPTFTDWEKYIAFVKTIVIAVVAEFRGDLIPEAGASRILGFDLDGILRTLFGSFPMHVAMAQEFRAFILMSTEKSRNRTESELFSRYLNALAESPGSWFRLRDCDALARYTIACALVCNGFDDDPFSETQWQLLAEMANGQYDAVAYHKHEAEGETNSTFAYVGSESRPESFQMYRDILWAVDAKLAQDPVKRVVLNFIRPFAGPLHIMTRRYRFVEDGLMIGKPATATVVEQTRQHVKLWHRIDEPGGPSAPNPQRGELTSYEKSMAQSAEVMFDGLKDLLQGSEKRHCPNCAYAPPTDRLGQFCGVRLCKECQERWKLYIRSFPKRLAAGFPEVGQILFPKL